MARGLPSPWKRFKSNGVNYDWYVTVRQNGRQKQVFLAEVDTTHFPAETVDWKNAALFCQKLSRLDRQDRTFRLPAEAEWEYACRAGTTTPFHFGKELNGEQANCNGAEPYRTKAGPWLGRPTKVGSYAANRWGLYDMHGNVCEWCQDWYGEDYYASSPPRDPQGPKDGPCRVRRGGSWIEPARRYRAAYRLGFPLDQRWYFNGFHIAYRPE